MKMKKKYARDFFALIFSSCINFVAYVIYQVSNFSKKIVRNKIGDRIDAL